MHTSVIRIIFFGSTDDSLIVLRKLSALVIGNWKLEIVCVVTQPPRPVGRKQTVIPTPVEIWAKEQAVPVLSFPSNPDKPWMYMDENQVIDSLEPFKADLVVSACYGQKIPQKTIADARFGGLNVHPSLLPRWRGADPVPWAILSGDHQTGVTIVTLSEKFDAGTIIAQKKLPILATDTSDALRTRLFIMGSELLVLVFPDYIANTSFPRTRESREQKTGSPIKSGMTIGSYARRLTRDDGFEPWEAIQRAVTDPIEAERLERKFRAFHPWPGVWTKIQVKSQKSKVKSEEKRLKILACHLDTPAHRLVLDTVQREGKKPVSWAQFQTAYLPRTQAKYPHSPTVHSWVLGLP